MFNNRQQIIRNVQILGRMLIIIGYVVWEIINSANRRWWERPVNNPPVRERYGAYFGLYKYFKFEDHEMFKQYLRMEQRHFCILYEKLKDRLKKKNTKFRPSLPPELRLSAVLSYLAHGNSVRHGAWFQRIGQSTMYSLIEEVCEIIVGVLKPEYLKTPNEDDWKNIAAEIFQLHGMPNCVGSIDGKHVRINAPPASGSVYFNYKRYFSVVLMATCDAYYRFTWASVGYPGSQNDTSIFYASDLGQALATSSANLPPPQNIPETNVEMPFYFLGDGGFPLRSYLMIPYIRTPQFPLSEANFNKRLSSVRQTIECSFGILANRWKILQKAINFKPTTRNNVVIALICLHNFIITHELIDKTHMQYSVISNEENIFQMDGIQAAAEPSMPLNHLAIRDRLNLYLNSHCRRTKHCNR